MLIALNIVLACCGYLLPLPSAVMSWISWMRAMRTRGPISWRDIVTHFALVSLTLGVGLWIYAILRDAWLRDYSYIVPSAHIGRWGSLVLVAVSAFASGKIRKFLIVGAVGLLFFFGSSIGDIAI